MYFFLNMTYFSLPIFTEWFFTSYEVVIKDEAAELCSMPYRAPELFVCAVGSVIDQSVDIWVRFFDRFYADIFIARSET